MDEVDVLKFLYPKMQKTKNNDDFFCFNERISYLKSS